MADQPVLSIVVPMHDEKANLQALHQRLCKAVEPVTRDFEILFVDDGSRDGSPATAESLIATDPRVKLIEFSRNFGKESAILAGYDHAAGQAVIVMDADLQTPPEVLPELIHKWRQGAEVVDAIRDTTVGQGLPRALASRAFYWIMRRLADTEIVPNSVDFRLLDQRVVQHVRSCRERCRFNRGLVSWVGFRHESVTFTAHRRHAGQSRWRPLRLLGYAMDGIFAFSSRPLRLAGLLGATLSVLSLAYMVALVVDRLVRGQPMPGYATLAGGCSFWAACNCCASGSWASTWAGCTRRPRVARRISRVVSWIIAASARRGSTQRIRTIRSVHPRSAEGSPDVGR